MNKFSGAEHFGGPSRHISDRARVSKVVGSLLGVVAIPSGGHCFARLCIRFLRVQKSI